YSGLISGEREDSEQDRGRAVARHRGSSQIPRLESEVQVGDEQKVVQRRRDTPDSRGFRNLAIEGDKQIVRIHFLANPEPSIKSARLRLARRGPDRGKELIGILCRV